MKKITFLLALLFLWPLKPLWAVQANVWASSNTATIDTNQTLCGQYAVNGATSTLHAVVHEVIVSSAIAATTVTLYNSSFTATGVQSIGPVMTSSLGSYVYDSVFPNGLNYTKTGGAQIQILYVCY